VRGAPLKPLPVTALQDRPFVSFPDGEVDRACGAWDERHDGGFVAVTHDAKRAVPAAAIVAADLD
jgi:hypothetical protein